MNVLLDTHTLLWIITEDAKLNTRARDIYLDPRNQILFSQAGIWEIAIKISLNKLDVGPSLAAFVDEHIRGNGIRILNIALDHIYEVAKLPYHHRDPFDRLLICQGIVEQLPILSADTKFDLYPVRRIWD